MQGDLSDALDHAESVLRTSAGENQTVQPSLQALNGDADIQLRKACSLLEAGRTLRHGDNFVALVELSFNAIERTFQHYLVDTTSIDSSDLHEHEQVYDEMGDRSPFGGPAAVDRIYELRRENRASMYYDVEKPTEEQAAAMLALAEALHQRVVDLNRKQSVCGCS